jgi:hypothetical protein
MFRAPTRSVSRRSFLQVGALGVAGLTLPDLLRLRAAGSAKETSRSKSVIMIYLPGGPSHIDMYDMKPSAPAEYRGEFKPVRTKVPGFDICEHLPLQAKIADKLSVVRGLKTWGAHDPYELLTAQRAQVTGKNPANPRPAFGCVVSKLKGGHGDGMPPYVGIKDLRLLGSYDDPETPAYLGVAAQPFRTGGPGLADLALAPGVTHDGLAERRGLLQSFDTLRRDVDNAQGAVGATDKFRSRALDILSSDKVRDAFDLGKEPEKVRQAYGSGAASDFLLARRLVEAGVSVVTLPARFFAKIGDFTGGVANHWDTHAHHFKFTRLIYPQYDHAISALINDLHQRGLADDVLVVVWGEFGRTPRIGDVTPDGRGHWPEAGFALLSGGGLNMGVVAGETDAKAERAKGVPFSASHVLATIYRVLGIDPAATVPDHAGRPQYILDNREPVRELL